MLGRAMPRHASSERAEKTQSQSPLRSNIAAANTLPNALKRKLDRTMSTSNSLQFLHQQSSFDENTDPRVSGIVDLTTASPEKGSDIRYPVVGGSDVVSYPSLPPLPSGPPSSSAPVPWSSSPESHYVDPKTRPPPEQLPPSPAPARPHKRRALPASFATTFASSASDIGPYGRKASLREGDTTQLPSSGKDNNFTSKNGDSTGFDSFPGLKHFQHVQGSDKASTAMAGMLQPSSYVRQRPESSISRTMIERPLQANAKPSENENGAPGRMAEPFLSDEQKAVVTAVMEKGKSVFFTGSAGTGKSVLMRAIISQLRHKFRKDPDRIAITASTGLASCILEGQTLHSWAGIGLGKEPVPELVKKIKRNQKSRQRWVRTKVLIVDEVSMVDGQLFDKLEQIARTMKNNGRPFGGMQLVVTGDFFQLPPVPDKNSSAKFVFESVTWNTCIEHTILLTHVFRQKDEQFAAMLNEMRLGQMSPATVREFKSLSRPLNFHDELEATELYPRREEVENANQNRMRRLSGQIMTFEAVDSGVQDLNIRKSLLNNFIAPELLELKKGAQVMLIKNIDGQLVNGSLGIVQSFMDEGTFFTYKDDEPTFLLAQKPGDGEQEDDIAAAREKIRDARMKNSSAGPAPGRLWPMVRFNLPDGTSRTMLCSPDEWKTEAHNGEILAKRVQVPLILAWALSIHKAQGQTLSRVKVDLGKVFEKGQAYVALSRARSKEGLQVLRFDERRVMVHPRVLQFYSKLSGHETLVKKDKEAAKPPVEEDDFEDEFSYEEMLEAEKQLLRGNGRM